MDRFERLFLAIDSWRFFMENRMENTDDSMTDVEYWENEANNSSKNSESYSEGTHC